MQDWALVIGIDHYAISNASLNGAVRDALGVRSWLLDPDGGGLSEDHVVTVLGPSPGTDPGVEAQAAATDSVIRAVNELVQRSGGQGDRLYFYFSGHGLSAMQSFSAEDAIVFADFEWLLPQKSLAVRSLLEYFEALEFADQFIFIDACRNAPRVKDIVFGVWPRPAMRDYGKPPVQQFVLYATSPGLRAAEVAIRAGDEGGAFTQELLDGLRGHGRAKRYDSEHDTYAVHWDDLVSYVTSGMEQRRQNVAEARAQELLQIPQEGGVHGVAGRSGNPRIVEIPLDRLPERKLSLDIVLAPEDVVQVAQVRVFDDAAVPLQDVAPITAVPVRLELAPRTYSIHALAPKYDTAVCRPPVDLYESCSVALHLSPSEAVEPPPAPADVAPDGQLVVTCKDPYLPIELYDAAGDLLVTATGRLESRHPPGAYRVVLRAPVGAPVEQTVEVVAGESCPVELGVPEPEPLVAELAEHTALSLNDDHTLEVSTAVGPIGGAALSTVLGLAGAAALAGQTGHEERLRDLGAKAIQEVLATGASSALYTLVGVSGVAAGAASVDDVGLACWPFDTPVPEAVHRPQELTGHPALGERAMAAAPGEHWVAIHLPEGNPLVLPVLVLERRVTLLVLEIHAGGVARAFTFIPPCQLSSEDDLRFLRQVELLQQIAVSPRLQAGESLARELAHGPTTPIASTLGAYSLFRLGHIRDLGDVTERLTDEYPELSDAHVLRAEFEAAVGNLDAAAASIEAALDAGVPIFGEGLTRLLDGVAKFRKSHPRARTVSRVQRRYVHGSLFSLWQPEELAPGELLVR